MSKSNMIYKKFEKKNLRDFKLQTCEVQSTLEIFLGMFVCLPTVFQMLNI